MNQGTATPERMDGRNIYEICDYNVPYEISLGEAINKGMLVPFRYYGIYGDTDYSKLHVVKGHYTEKELNETYLGNVHRCPAAHCGRRKPHGIFSRFAYPIVPCRDLPRFSPGLAARWRSLV